MCWTPFYGLGIIIGSLIYNFVSKRIQNKYQKNLVLFIIFFIFFSIFEYLGGITLEKLYHESFWDYSKIPLHLGKYILVVTSLLWSVMVLFYLYKIKPFTDKLISKVPNIITVLLIILFIIDCFFSLLKVF